MTTDVVVVGAGILGISAAYHLAQHGLAVTVLERESGPAHHASGKGAGMIRQLYHHPQLTDWARRSIDTWPEAIRTRIFQQTGSLIVGRKPPNHHHELFQAYSLASMQDSSLPNTPCVVTETDGLVDPADLTNGIFSLIPKHRVRFHFRTAVTSLEPMHDRWNVRTANGLDFSSHWVINAAGAWLNDLFIGELAAQLTCDAHPFARHLFVVSGFNADAVPGSDYGFYWEENQEWYLRRWETRSGTGARLVSICDKTAALPDSFSPSSTVAEELAAKMTVAFPHFAANLKLERSWHCFRTYTPDRLPIWGPDERFPGLFWLAAFGGYGISTGFAAAADAARFIAGSDISFPHEFLPARTKIGASTSKQTVLKVI